MDVPRFVDRLEWPNFQVELGRSYVHAELQGEVVYVHDIHTNDDRFRGVARAMLEKTVALGLEFGAKLFATTPETYDGQEFFKHIFDELDLRVRRCETLTLPLEKVAKVLRHQ